MKKTSLKASGLSSPAFGRILCTTLEALDAREKKHSVERTGELEGIRASIHTCGKVVIYGTSLLTDLRYSAYNGKKTGHELGLGRIFQDIKARAESAEDNRPTQFIVPIAEFRDGLNPNKIGHFCVLVIQYNDGAYQFDVIDSKPESFIFGKYVMYLNSDLAIAQLAKESMELNVKVNRHYYSHQQSLNDNLCSAFSMLFIQEACLDTMHSDEGTFNLKELIKRIQDPANKIETEETFLSPKDIAYFEDLIQKDVTKQTAKLSEEIRGSASSDQASSIDELDLDDFALSDDEFAHDDSEHSSAPAADKDGSAAAADGDDDDFEIIDKDDFKPPTS